MDKLERVARAIADSDGYEWSKCTHIEREEYLDNAQAAIAALSPVTVQEVTTQRALEIVLSRCKMDNGTAHVLKGLLGYARARALAERGE